MNIHNGIPIINAHLEDQIISDNARAVDQHGDRSQLSSSLLHGFRRSRLVSDVGADGHRTTAGLDDRVRSSRTAWRVKIDNANRHSVGGESMSDCSTDAARRTSDDGDCHDCDCIGQWAGRSGF